MNDDERRPDYGVFLQRQAKAHSTVMVTDFVIFRIGQVEDDLFSVTSNAAHGGETYAATVDMSRELYEELAAAAPEPVGDALRQLAAAPFDGPRVMGLPKPLSVDVVATFGEAVTNDGETYVPLVGSELTVG